MKQSSRLTLSLLVLLIVGSPAAQLTYREMRLARILIGILFLSLLPAAAPAPIGGTIGAQEFPSRTITIVVPFAAGGDADIFGRIFAQRLAPALGRAVIVDNRAGASGNIGAEAVVRAAPDGHTILYASSSLAVSRALYTKLSFSAERDLAPVSQTVSIPLVLVVHPSLPARNVKELLALGRAHPGALMFSGGGTGGLPHLTGELFKLQTKLDARHIAYSGLGLAQTALLSGEVQFAFLSPPVVRAYVSSGRLRALGISVLKRSAALPDVATLHEAGVMDFEALHWHGFFLPAKTPATVVTRFHAEVVKALATPEIKERVAAEGANIVGGSPADLAAFFRSEAGKWADVAKRSGTKIE
jgi:tripartite-type tricarboxylate transporter receptor subunit TctC